MKKLNLDIEIPKTQSMLRTDPNHMVPFLGRIRTHLYYRLLLDCRKHGDQPLAHRIVDIITEHYRREDALRQNPEALPLPEDQSETVRALALLWKCSPADALARLVARTGDDLLDREIDAEEARRKQQQVK